MIKIVPLPAGADIIISREEYGFQNVLDALPTARQVWVLTYSISTAHDNRLLEHLEQLGSAVELLIVSNIPSNYARKRSAIEAYLRLLRPERFRAKVQTFYNFHNHAKVVAMEDAMYLGSGNFSGGENLECGVLVRGRQTIKQTIEAVVPLALRGARPHPTTYAEVVRLWVEGVGADLRNHLPTFKTVFGDITDKMSAPITDLLADRCDVLDAYDDFADTFGQVVAEAEQDAAELRGLGIPVESLKNLHRLLSLDTVRDFLNHDRQKFVKSYVADNPSPHIDALHNDACYYEDEHRRELRAAAGDCLVELDEAVQALLTAVDRACDTVASLGSPPSEKDACGPV